MCLDFLLTSKKEVFPSDSPIHLIQHTSLSSSTWITRSIALSLFSDFGREKDFLFLTNVTYLLQLCFVIAFALISGLDAAAVRVKIANNPFLYEIAQPSERQEAVAIPIHPVRGFQAAAAEQRERRLFVSGLPNAGASQSAPLSAPLRTSEQRQPLATRQAEPEPEIIQPYNIAYDSIDNNGTQMKREESKDEKGVVRGSYR